MTGIWSHIITIKNPAIVLIMAGILLAILIGAVPRESYEDSSSPLVQFKTKNYTVSEYDSTVTVEIIKQGFADQIVTVAATQQVRGGYDI